MEDTMRLVMDAAGSVNAVGDAEREGGRHQPGVTTITKVADQTNLLSLNAAIVAEKAGETGEGRRCGTEIRGWRTRRRFIRHHQTVKVIQSAVSAGVMSMDKFSEEYGADAGGSEVGRQLSQVIQQVGCAALRGGH